MASFASPLLANSHDLGPDHVSILRPIFGRASNELSALLAYAVALGGTAGDEWTEATPLVEDGFIYVTDSGGVVYKIDGTSGQAGRIVWRMEPKQEKQANNRGASLWGNLVISPA